MARYDAHGNEIKLNAKKRDPRTVRSEKMLIAFTPEAKECVETLALKRRLTPTELVRSLVLEALDRAGVEATAAATAAQKSEPKKVGRPKELEKCEEWWRANIKYMPMWPAGWKKLATIKKNIERMGEFGAQGTLFGFFPESVPKHLLPVVLQDARDLQAQSQHEHYLLVADRLYKKYQDLGWIPADAKGQALDEEEDEA